MVGTERLAPVRFLQAATEKPGYIRAGQLTTSIVVSLAPRFRSISFGAGSLRPRRELNGGEVSGMGGCPTGLRAGALSGVRLQREFWLSIASERTSINFLLALSGQREPNAS